MSQTLDETRSVAESQPDASVGAPTRQSYKSFKKKFAKLKMKFEMQMGESEALIREGLRIEDLSKRIQEQNDQLLEVLLEFNDSLHVSPSLRYDLSAPGDETFLPPPDRDIPASYNDPAIAGSMLKDAKGRMAAGRMNAHAYRELEDDVRRSKAFAPRLQYTSLTQVPHSAPLSDNQPEDHYPAQDLGFLTPEHETEYYLALDAKMGDESAIEQLVSMPSKSTLVERTRDANLRIPISVHNWLRRNQPQIFLQDNENASEKSGSRPSRASKRATAQARKDEDMYDDDGSYMETASTTGGVKGKRKRDEDSGYRPKGGSSRPSRKKKDKDDDGSTPAKRTSKRSSGINA